MPEPMDVPAPPEPAPPSEPAQAQKPAPPPPKQAEKPAKPKPAPKDTAAPAKPSPARAPPKRTETKAAGKGERTAGSRLGKDFLKGLGLEKNNSTSQTPTGAVMSAAAMTDRRRDPAPDPALRRPAGEPRAGRQPDRRQTQPQAQSRRIDGRTAKVVSVSGVDEENGRYQKRVEDLAVAAFTGCAPLRELPPDLYQTARGGWSNLNMNYKLPDEEHHDRNQHPSLRA